MRSLSTRLGVGVVYACVFFAVIAGAIGAVGIVAVRSATATGNSITSDELATATATAQFGQQVDTVYSSGQTLALTSNAAQRTQIASSLYSQQLPATDAALSAVQRNHADDSPSEHAGIIELGNQWTTFRNLLDPTATLTGSPDPALAAQLSSAYQPLTVHVAELIARENTDGRDDQAGASAASLRARWTIALAVIAAILATIGLGWTAIRRLRRAVEPGEEQIEFADTLQLAEDEEEAHQLLQRHLERTVSHSTVTVLNRNNSADRLEAVTALAADSPLIATLAHAEPRACLAVRSGRSHDEDSHRPALLGCPVCAQCPGTSTCTPLTVGGEVIGSVLVNRPSRYNGSEQQHIRDSVGQAAPVLANLRNLAIAELRAATDSLTGLPNKRAVDDTLKRMLAQASRTFTPLSLLLLDLDHFKNINDRFGHPAGDQALANVGAALRSVLRDSDFAGRNGGEEFAILLPDTDSSGAVLTADKIRAAIAEISLPGLDLEISASVGIATYPDHATGPDRLESLADSALYLAKRSGRDRIEVALPASDSTRLLAAEPPVVDVAPV
jgi:diguanylate cyclase (GGDEF)-like protein